jgi:hypothetical protein
MNFATSGTGIPTTVDFTDPISVANFINALSNWQGSMSGDGNISAEEIQ